MPGMKMLEQMLDAETLDQIDAYEQVSLAYVVHICRQSASMADAGRKLFNRSRSLKASVNDSHRVKQILSKFGLSFAEVKSAQS